MDHALLELLRADGRISNVELAARSGVSEKTVRLRLARLESEHGLRYTAVLPEPDAASRLVCLLRTSPWKRDEVSAVLAGLPGVERTYLASGAADIVLLAGFPDDSAALGFLVESVQTVPGVESVQSCHLIGAVTSGRDGDAARSPIVDRGVLSELLLAGGVRQSVGELLGALCDAAAAGLGADRVLICRGEYGRGEPGRSVLEIVANRGVPREYVDEMSARLDGRVHGVLSRVAESRMHVAVHNAAADPLMSGLGDLVRDAGYTSLLALPMLYGDALLAVVCLYFDEPTVLTADYVAAAQQVVDFFSVSYARSLGLAPSGLPSNPPAI
ncbi:AsnC family transcriptional regulator [Tsukamurella sp. NPDC003166]|uniref:AsnC family transcriptional regulator n=1 Tax=Tsukamurella sp. NPDC003166 TaxID=3154444 RepID=UPI0033A6D92F